jgi:hypothetical protein
LSPVPPQTRRISSTRPHNWLCLEWFGSISEEKTSRHRPFIPYSSVIPLPRRCCHTLRQISARDVSPRSQQVDRDSR